MKNANLSQRTHHTTHKTISYLKGPIKLGICRASVGLGSKHCKINYSYKWILVKVYSVQKCCTQTFWSEAPWGRPGPWPRASVVPRIKRLFNFKKFIDIDNCCSQIFDLRPPLTSPFRGSQGDLRSKNCVT